VTVMSHKSKVRAVIPKSVRRPEKSGGQVIDIDTLRTLLENNGWLEVHHWFIN
jgi:hypothetical protein